MSKKFTRSTEIQSLLFDKSKWTVRSAQKWLRSHNHSTKKMSTSDRYHRFNQSPPFRFQKGTFRTINIGSEKKGIKAIVASPRDGAVKQNPIKPIVKTKPKKSRIPSTMVDLANARQVELVNGEKLKFNLADNFAMCSNVKGDEIWIVSRKGSKRVSAQNGGWESLFEGFTGFEADDIGDLIRKPSLQLKRVGRAVSIIYRSDKFDNKSSDYIHGFTDYPTVSVDTEKNPKIVALRGGKIRITPEGIKG